MKLAIISVTAKGAVLAERLAARLNSDIAVYAKEGRAADRQAQSYTSLRELVEKIFAEYDGLIFIMAAGIVVRVIAPFLLHKCVDPAVVVIDDGGHYAISLLSGHIGRANELAREAALALAATPVITTATDVAGKVAPDVLSGKLGLKIEPFTQLKTVNAALANGESVGFFLDASLPQAGKLKAEAGKLQVNLQDFTAGIKNECWRCSAAAVLITDKLIAVEVSHVFLRPPTLIIGVGCRRGTDCEAIMAAIQAACGMIGRSVLSIRRLASVDVKQNEPGLLAAGEQLGVKLDFFDRQQLQQCVLKYKLAVSNFVQAQIGVGNVCEAAALLSARNHQLILDKTKFQQVTVAIAEAR